MADNETIADIIAEMRGMGNYQRYSGDHARVLAGRLEAAHKRERGDCAKLREALKLCVDEMCDRCRESAAASGNPLPCLSGCEPVRKAKSALSAPPRNCDVYTADELKVKFKSELASELPIANEHEKNLVAITAMGVIDTLLAPATEKEGGAK